MLTSLDVFSLPLLCPWARQLFSSCSEANILFVFIGFHVLKVYFVFLQQKNICTWQTTSEPGSTGPASLPLISEECLLAVIRPLIKLMGHPWMVSLSSLLQSCLTFALGPPPWGRDFSVQARAEQGCPAHLSKPLPLTCTYVCTVGRLRITCNRCQHALLPWRYISFDGRMAVKVVALA